MIICLAVLKTQNKLPVIPHVSKSCMYANIALVTLCPVQACITYYDLWGLEPVRKTLDGGLSCIATVMHDFEVAGLVSGY